MNLEIASVSRARRFHLLGVDFLILFSHALPYYGYLRVGDSPLMIVEMIGFWLASCLLTGTRNVATALVGTPLADGSPDPMISRSYAIAIVVIWHLTFFIQAAFFSMIGLPPGPTWQLHTLLLLNVSYAIKVTRQERLVRTLGVQTRREPTP